MIGIGGAGMSGIAEVLARGGHEVTGSDLKESPTPEAARGRRQRLHRARLRMVGNADQVVISTP